eukprot:764834-Amphidinium_carterae.1
MESSGKGAKFSLPAWIDCDGERYDPLWSAFREALVLHRPDAFNPLSNTSSAWPEGQISPKLQIHRSALTDRFHVFWRPNRNDYITVTILLN